MLGSGSGSLGHSVWTGLKWDQHHGVSPHFPEMTLLMVIAGLLDSTFKIQECNAQKNLGDPVQSGFIIIFPWNMANPMGFESTFSHGTWPSHISTARYSYDAQPSGNLFYSPHAATSNVAPANYGTPSVSSGTVTRHGLDMTSMTTPSVGKPKVNRGEPMDNQWITNG